MILNTTMHEEDNASTVDFGSDYSAETKYGILQPPEDTVWGIMVISGIIECSSQIKPADFGDIVDGLTTGLVFEVADDEEVYLTFSDDGIKTNEDFFYMSSAVHKTWDIFETNTYMYKFQVDLGTQGEPIILEGDSNQRIQILFDEDFSSFLTFRFFASGFQAPLCQRSLGLINARYILPRKSQGE